VDSELVRGSGGIFVVSANNTKLFSKKEMDRFPTESEVIEKLRSLGL
jgi:hypothetical protein